MKFDIYSQKGNKLSKKIDLDESVFDVEVDEYLLNLAVQVYLGNQRQTNAHTQTRGEVRGGGAKPWRQKGTGRARHGSIRSPIWKGGGVTFGPRNDRNYKRKLSKKMKKNAIRGVLSLFAKSGDLLVLDKVEIKDGRLTNQVVKMVEKLPTGKKVLIVHSGKNKNLYLGSRNLQTTKVIPVNEVNIFDLLNSNTLIILQDVLDKMTKFWGFQKQKDKSSVTKKVKTSKKKEVKKKKTQKKSQKSQDKKEIEKKKKEESIKDLDLGTRIENALKEEGIETVEELQKLVKLDEISEVPGIGKKSVEKIKKVLEK